MLRQLKEETITAAEIGQLKKIVAPHVRQLSQIKPWRGFVTIGSIWGVIAVAILISLATHNPIIYIIAIFVVASRQHALVGLMHEGVHYRLHQNEKVNNFLSDWLCAYPVMMKTSIYRRHHLLHHRHLNTAEDPDWARKINLPEWQFPMTKMKFLKIYSKYLYGFGVIETIKLCQYLSGLKEARPKIFEQLCFYSLSFGVITYFKMWNVVLLFWVIPAFTVFPLIMKIRSVAEHFGLENSHELNGSRNVLVSKLEGFFIVPINLSYHLDHHLFPTIPFYNLPFLHRELVKHDAYKLNAHRNSSMLGAEETALGRDLITN